MSGASPGQPVARGTETYHRPIAGRGFPACGAFRYEVWVDSYDPSWRLGPCRRCWPTMRPT